MGLLVMIGNGFRQVRIISPLLFKFDMNSLIEDIQQLKQGCSLGYVKTNMICYADDIFLLSPSVSGLQLLIDRVCYFLNEPVYKCK